MIDTIGKTRFMHLTGISEGRLQRWSERGLLQPVAGRRAGRGCCRRYGFNDALRATFMLELIHRGFTVPAAANITRLVVPEFLSAIKPRQNREKRFVALITGKTKEVAGRIHLKNPRTKVEATAAAVRELAQHRGPCYLIPLQEMAEQLRGRYLRMIR